MTINVAIFGGAFDPPTLGHARCIQYALGSGVRMDKVFIVPSGHRVDKPHQTAYHHRFAMCELAFGKSDGEKSFVGAFEAPEKRPGPVFTYDTLTILRRLYPWWNFHLLVGEDNSEDRIRETWYKGEELLTLLAGLIAVPRSDENSTAIRKAFQEGREPPNWLHPQVASYIQQHRLYGYQG